MPKRKLTFISIESKKKALKLVENGAKKKDVSEQFGIPPYTLSTWIKNKEKIMGYEGRMVINVCLQFVPLLDLWG